MEDPAPTQDLPDLETLMRLLSQYYLPGRAWARRKTNPMEEVPLIGNRDEITGGKSLTL